ncbi:MAG: hypothetical protein SGI92_24190 [Bryobacteraceae bacterium]|nr:hypothetical protein [Bryobacteraceae bacterium]
MSDDFAVVFSALKSLFTKQAPELSVTTDNENGYILHSKSASSFPQHKGQPLYFGGVRVGAAYVSFYLMPLYMCPTLNQGISQALKKRMQGKSCFNFKTVPSPELLAELGQLTEAGFRKWSADGWL